MLEKMPRGATALSRREWLALAGASLVLKAARARASGVDLELGIQLWSVQEALHRDFEGTLREVAAAGFRRVELAEIKQLGAAEMRSALASAGLECPSAHVRFWEIDDDLPALIARARQIGLRYLVVPMPWIPPDVLKRARAGDMMKVLARELTLEHWKKTAELLNSYGRICRDAGIELAYHNHNIDFKPDGGVVPYELLVTSTDSATVHFELDCGWVASAGLDPVVYLKRWPHRFMGLHVKDVKAGFVPNFAMQTLPTEVGSGVMDWPAILRAAWSAGVRQYYLEQEPPFSRPPLESLKIGRDYINRIASTLSR